MAKEYDLEEVLEVFTRYGEERSENDRDFLLNILGYPLPKGKVYVRESVISQMRSVLKRAKMIERSRDNYHNMEFSVKMRESFENILYMLEQAVSLSIISDVTVEIAKIKDFQLQVGSKVTEVKEIYYSAEGMTIEAKSSASRAKITIDTEKEEEMKSAHQENKRAAAECLRAIKTFGELIEVIDSYEDQFKGTFAVVRKSILESSLSQRDFFKKYTSEIIKKTDEYISDYLPDIPVTGISISGESVEMKQKPEVESGFNFSIKDMSDAELEKRGMVRLEVVIEKNDGTKEKGDIIKKIKPNNNTTVFKPSKEKIQPNKPGSAKKVRNEDLTPAEMNDYQLAKIGLKRVKGFTRKDGVKVKSHFRKIKIK